MRYSYLYDLIKDKYMLMNISHHKIYFSNKLYLNRCLSHADERLYFSFVCLSFFTRLHAGFAVCFTAVALHVCHVEYDH